MRSESERATSEDGESFGVEGEDFTERGAVELMYKIKGWNETFENADTRKRVRLGWFHCPSGVDSQGYIELMSHGVDGVQAFGVFLAICQWSATCLPVTRGSCARSDGRPLTARQLAAQIRMPVEVVQKALALLVLPEIGWIYEEKEESADDLPVACQLSATCLPQGKGKGQGEGEGQGNGKVGGEASESPSPPDTDPADCQFPVFPCISEPKIWTASPRQLQSWKETYPAVDIDHQHRRAHSWVMSNLINRKTAKGMPKFLNTWFSKEQDRAKPTTQQRTFAQISLDNSKRAMEDFCNG